MVPTMPFTFRTGSATHVGRVRTLNEDRVLARPDLGLWVVADGMGGHAAGDRASGTLIAALETIGRVVSAADLLAQFEDRVIRANAELRGVARQKGIGVIGTTVAAVLAHAQHFACVWSGDSRIYLFREGKLRQMSRDHTEVQDLVDRGILAPEEAKSWPRRNVITRAIGVHDDAELEFREGALMAGDRFVLCSDGLTNHVEDAEVAIRAAGDEPQRACDDLITLALERGGTDNVSVVIVACETAPQPETAPSTTIIAPLRRPADGEG